MGRDVGSSKRVPTPAGEVLPAGAGVAPVPAKDAALSGYLEKLYKIIPVELTAAYLAISSLLTDEVNATGNVYTLLLFAILLTILTPFYLYRFQSVRTKSQLLVSTLSFPVWAACISTAVLVAAVPSIKPQMVTVLMVGWVLVTPLLVSDKAS